jgi:hypothetical protein
MIGIPDRFHRDVTTCPVSLGFARDAMGPRKVTYDRHGLGKLGVADAAQRKLGEWSSWLQILPHRVRDLSILVRDPDLFQQ